MAIIVYIFLLFGILLTIFFSIFLRDSPRIVKKN